MRKKGKCIYICMYLYLYLYLYIFVFVFVFVTQAVCALFGIKVLVERDFETSPGLMDLDKLQIWRQVFVNICAKYFHQIFLNVYTKYFYALKFYPDL